MRRPGRLVVALAVSALVAAGGITTALAASPTVQATCNGSNTSSGTTWTSCQIGTQDIGLVSAITLVVTLESGDGQNDQYIGVSWQGFCGPNGNANATASITPPATNPPPKMQITAGAPISISLALPYTDPRFCDVSATATLYTLINGGTTWSVWTNGTYKMDMDSSPWPQASPSPSPSASGSSSASAPVNVPLIKGYGGKCVDDKANRSANRTEVIIWTCNSADPSQGWKFTGGDLVHDGKCANDQGNGGSGTKVILWTCTHGADETWSHTSGDGEFVLASRSHGQLCLTDPGHSTANRTQLVVSACRNTGNQHWT
jgi:Ricin-type beta-trefoil lectin domain